VYARRKFVDEYKISQGQSSSAEMLELIRMLYDIEQEQRKKSFGDGGSKDGVAFLAARRKAITYTRGMWPRLIRYLDCSYLTPDNSEAGRAIHGRQEELGHLRWPPRRLLERRPVFHHRDGEALRD
jgi:hypothetical protein